MADESEEGVITKASFLSIWITYSVCLCGVCCEAQDAPVASSIAHQCRFVRMPWIIAGVTCVSLLVSTIICPHWGRQNSFLFFVQALQKCTGTTYVLTHQRYVLHCRTVWTRQRYEMAFVELCKSNNGYIKVFPSKIISVTTPWSWLRECSECVQSYVIKAKHGYIKGSKIWKQYFFKIIM